MDFHLTPTYLALYAEMHYTLRWFFSFLKKRQPEVLADAPFRVEPSKQIPILCLIKDADRYPIQLEKIVISVRYMSGRSQEVSFPFSAVVDVPLWYKVLPLAPLEQGSAAVDVAFHFRDRKGDHLVHNDNYRTTSHAPLSVFVAGSPLPKGQGWHYGEAHYHSIYTADQVEFGAPLPAAAKLAQAMGLDWMAVTDHSYDLDDCPGNPLRNDPNLLLWVKMKQEVIHLNHKHDGFITLVGEEISCGNRSRKNIHLSGYGLKDFIKGSGDSAERWLKVSPELSIPEVLSEIHGKGGVAYAAHPCERVTIPQRFILQRHRWGRIDFQEEHLSGLQFWNGKNGAGFEKGRQEWIRLLLEGKKIFALGGSDAHGDFNRSRRIKIPFLTIRESTQHIFGKVRSCLLLRKGLSEDSVLTALGGGNFIITDGPFVALRLQNEDGTEAGVGEKLAGRRITLQIEADTTEEFGKFDQIKLFRGDLSERREQVFKWFKGVDSNQAPIAGLKVNNLGSSYFRIEARTKKGNFCITNPIWIETAG